MNIPNLLSISRILTVPLFIILMLEPTPFRALVAAIIFSPCLGHGLARRLPRAEMGPGDQNRKTA